MLLAAALISVTATRAGRRDVPHPRCHDGQPPSNEYVAVRRRRRRARGVQLLIVEDVTATAPTTSSFFAALTSAWAGQPRRRPPAVYLGCARTARFKAPDGAGAAQSPRKRVDSSPDHAYGQHLDVCRSCAPRAWLLHRERAVVLGRTNQYAGWRARRHRSPTLAPAQPHGLHPVRLGRERRPAAHVHRRRLPHFPPSGPVKTTSSAVAYEGDAGLTGGVPSATTVTGDELRRQRVPARRSGGAALVEQQLPRQQAGFDADLFSADPASSAATTSATVGGDQYLGVVTFATENTRPEGCSSSSIVDLDEWSRSCPATCWYLRTGREHRPRHRPPTPAARRDPTGTTFVPNSSWSTAIPGPTPPNW